MAGCVEIIPGISAAHAAGALLGAPLMSDYASISLSDLMTPLETIERRLEAVAASDMVVALYNPASARRRYSAGLDSSSDTALILGGPRGFYEAVDMVKGRRNFPLRVAGAATFGIVEFLGTAAALEPVRLEASLLGLRSETLRAAALVQLASVRLKAAATPR